ncbi:HR-like lesion-inducing protein-related [Striga asiatica]|uniref:HR-like lesion-inducing protein-related n=1 Tax=Striga asiatica TaxID=4170 RepID=A0A5A7PZR8_STRAF|nr:HR-like lesion-inducing protein-related [Striga asiatica]
MTMLHGFSCPLPLVKPSNVLEKGTSQRKGVRDTPPFSTTNERKRQGSKTGKISETTASDFDSTSYGRHHWKTYTSELKPFLSETTASKMDTGPAMDDAYGEIIPSRWTASQKPCGTTPALTIS